MRKTISDVEEYYDGTEKIIKAFFENDSGKKIPERHVTSYSVERLENELKSMHYTGENEMVDREVENVKLPYFALAFHGFLWENDRIPTQEEYFDQYINQPCFSKIDRETVHFSRPGREIDLKINGIKARALRSYPSLIRDFHFFLMSAENEKIQEAWYAMKRLDIAKGIDLQVKYKDQWFPLQFYVSTKRGEYFRKRKDFRHEGKNRNVFDVELDREDALKCGDFFLYRKSDLEKLLPKFDERIRDRKK